MRWIKFNYTSNSVTKGANNISSNQLPEFIIPDQQLDEEQVIFDIKNPSILNWIAIIIIALTLNLFLFLVFGTVASLIIISILVLIGIWAWKHGYSVLIKITNMTLEAKNQENQTLGDKIKYFLYGTFGLNFEKNKLYYIEGHTQNISISGKSSSKIIIEKCLETLSASFGIVLMILIITRPFGGDNPEFIFASFVFIGLISPILAFWIIPPTWIIEDVGLHELDTKTKNQRHFSEKIKNSFLSRFLGIAGLVGSFSYILTNSSGIANVIETQISDSVVEQAFFAAFILFFIILFVGGIALLITMIYLAKYHSDNVNKYRSWLITQHNIKIGITSIRIANKKEENYFTLNHEDKPYQKHKGEIKEND